jgi:hypothetical protein
MFAHRGSKTDFAHGKASAKEKDNLYAFCAFISIFPMKSTLKHRAFHWRIQRKKVYPALLQTPRLQCAEPALEGRNAAMAKGIA